MEKIQQFNTIPRPRLVTPKAITYIGNQNDNNHKNYFLNYSVIKDTLKRGLHPKYLSYIEKEIMASNEGGGWYDKWALTNDLT